MNEVESEYEEEAIKGAEEIVQEYLPYLEEQSELWLDGKYIISPYLKTKKDYKKLLLRQNQDYYVPDIQMIESYGSGKMLVKNEKYKAVFRLLNKEIKDQEETEGMLEELSGYIIREDWADGFTVSADGVKAGTADRNCIKRIQICKILHIPVGARR